MLCLWGILVAVGISWLVETGYWRWVVEAAVEVLFWPGRVWIGVWAWQVKRRIDFWIWLRGYAHRRVERISADLQAKVAAVRGGGR